MASLLSHLQYITVAFELSSRVYQNVDLSDFVGTHGSCVRCAIRRILY